MEGRTSELLYSANLLLISFCPHRPLNRRWNSFHVNARPSIKMRAGNQRAGSPSCAVVKRPPATFRLFMRYFCTSPSRAILAIAPAWHCFAIDVVKVITNIKATRILPCYFLLLAGF